MNFDSSDFSKGLKDFIAFFTVKHITVLLFVAAILVLVCQPHQFGGSAISQTCSDASCPFPRKDAQAQSETVSQENWSFVLNGSWEDRHPENEVFKAFRYNPDAGCAVILIKEVADIFSTISYSMETLTAFSDKSITVYTVQFPVSLGNDHAFYIQGSMPNKDVMKSWNLIKNGFGYSFNCFCHSENDVCQGIANTLEIK